MKLFLHQSKLWEGALLLVFDRSSTCVTKVLRKRKKGKEKSKKKKKKKKRKKKKKKKKNAFIVPLEFSFCSVTTSWTCHRCYGYGSSRWTFADWPSSLSLCVNNFFPSICVDHLCWSLSREIWRSFPPPPTICSNFDVDRRLGLILMNVN